MTCESCSNEVSATANFCPFCGVKLNPSERPQAQPEKSVASASGEENLLVTARCSQSKKPFLIRFERQGKSAWIARTATPLSEQRLRNPALQGTEIQGKIQISGEYPGCPHCGAGLLWLDKSCNSRVNCWNGADPNVSCPWCGSTGRIVKGAIGTLRGSADK
jgi:hypothetical protein